MQIYHNPRCSKSRQTLTLLQEKGVEPTIIEYLKEAPDVATLESLVQKLGVSVRDIIRTGEDEYKSLNLKNPDLSDKALLEAISENPRLLQRPIVVKGNKAIIGRPPENIEKLL